MTLTEAARAVAGALVEPFSDPTSRTWWPFLLVAAAIAVGIQGGGWRSALGVSGWRTASARLDVELLAVRQLLRVLGWLPRTGLALYLATRWVALLDALAPRPALALPGWLASAVYGLALFVTWDLSRFLLHAALHHFPVLWRFHEVHHSAEVLTPLTFHRVHPVEVALYEARGVLATALVAGTAFWALDGSVRPWLVLGVDGLGVGLNGVFGNLRHSHVWLRFPASVERWFLSPAQHQLHHTDAGSRTNLGVWLAVWDRLAGTFAPSPAAAPARFGLAAPGHTHDLGSALFAPFRPSSPGRFGAVVAALVAPLTGRADAPDPDDDPGEVVVVSAGGRPTPVGGAAHEIDEETLERYENDDIHKVVGRVPGVYVRSEDGFGLRPNIGMRGAPSDRSARVTLLEDGVPLAPAPYAGSAAYYFPLATRLVGVEVFKGPAAIAYGPQTIGGAVNLQTRGVPDRTAGALDAAFGSFSTIKLHGWGGTGNDRAGVVVEGAHLSSGGFKELDGGGPTGFERQDLMAKARVEAGDDRTQHALTLKLGYGRELSHETYLGLSAADFAATPYRRYAASAEDLMRWHHTQASLAWDGIAGGGSVTWRVVAYHNLLDRQWTKINGFAGGPDLHALLGAPDAGQAATYLAILRGEQDSVTPDQTLRLGTNDRRFQSFGLQSVGRWAADGDWVANTVEVGLRAHGDLVRRLHTEVGRQMIGGQLLDTGEPVSTTLDSVTDAAAIAAHVRDTGTFGPVTVAPGLRVEHVITRAGDTETGAVDPVARTVALPGLALSVAPSPWALVFAGIHRGFSPAPPGEPADVPSETAWNAEIGTRLLPGQSWLELTGFGSRYDNILGQCTLSAGCADADLDRAFSGGAVWVAGVEAAARQTVPLAGEVSATIGGTYTWTWSAFAGDFNSSFPLWGAVSAGDRLPYVPEHQGSAEVTADTPFGRASIFGVFRSAMRDVVGQGPIAADERLPPLATLDASIEGRITPTVRAYALIRNLTGAAVVESMRPFGARPGGPFTVMVGVKVAPVEKS